MNPCPKTKNFQSPELLQLAKECPHCMSCGVHNHGQVVAAHSNKIAHGKGMGTKAHDLCAFVCGDCHDIIDGRSHPEMIQSDRDEIWATAFFKTILWLIQDARLQLKKASDKLRGVA